MTVRAILESKGRHVHSVEPDAKLAFAVATLAQRRIGAVLVMSGGRLVIAHADDHTPSLDAPTVVARNVATAKRTSSRN